MFSEKKKVSIIIPFYNAKDNLKACLDSLFNQSYENYEIIAVNNNSNDGSEKTVEDSIEKNNVSKTLRLINEIKTGPAAARNAGVRFSQGDYIAFIDSDCIADSEWLKEGMASFCEPGICGVGGRVLPSSPSSIYEKFSAAFTTKSPPVKTYERFDFHEGGGFPSLNFIIKRESFQKVNGYNEDFFPSGEDYDLCIRLYKEGYKLKSIFDANVYHKHRSSLKKMIVQAFEYGLSHPKLLQHHFASTFIFDMPFLGIFRKKNSPITCWIDLNSADKKMFFLLLLSFAVPLVSPLLLIYYLYLIFFISKRLKTNNVQTIMIQLILMPILLILKSFFLTLGRTVGGLKNRVICF